MHGACYKTVQLVFVFLLFIACGAAEGQKVKQVDSKTLPGTTVTSHMNVALKKGQNCIFCSTFQLAWNELKETIIHGDIALADAPPMVEALNQNTCSKDDLSEKSYTARAGFAKDGIVDAINRELQKKFRGDAPKVSVNFNSPEDILAYAFLFKNLRFAEEFESLKRPLLFGPGERKEKVQAFGIEKYKQTGSHLRMEKQISILDDKGDSDFVIALHTRSQDDELILAKVPPMRTLGETVKSVLERASIKEPGSLHRDESLRIPKIDFNLVHSYSQLLNKFFLNKGFEHYFIAQAIQSVRFRLNEKGALLKSEARIVATLGISREYNFDRPFLVIMKEKKSPNPYLAMWIGNTELLLKYN